MTGVAAFFCCMALAAFLQASSAQEPLTDFSRDSLSLDGQWQCLRDHESAKVWQGEVAAGLEGWKLADVPGLLWRGGRQVHESTRCIWARRSFTISKGRAAKGAVLKWNGIRFGAAAWLNGKKVAEHPCIGPHTVLIPPDLVRAGRNEILLKVPGWAGVPKNKAGYPLVPTGAATQRWGSKAAAVYDDIYLEFYDRVYMKWVLAVPDLDAGTVTFRVWIDGAGRVPARVDLTARVRPAESEKDSGRAEASVATGRMPAEITVSLAEVKPWTPETPQLYSVELTARASGKLCDKVSFRFGMRTIEVAGGHYRLNGRRLRFRGSNLVQEWLWGGRGGIFNRRVKSYIVDEARAMNLNSFRTHTLPPPTAWLDVCDRYGTMILAELPVLYNHADFKFTPAELKVFHANALLDAAGWVRKLCNHPSLMIWVLSNESRLDTAWESGRYWRHVRGLDPTRPCLRTGDMAGTPETTDMHTCGNYGSVPEGQAIQTFLRGAARKDPKRTLTNTEYMNLFGPRQAYATRWLGRPDHPAERLTFAEFAMEHTEAMRRADFDGIFPYMYAGWTRLRGNNWRKDYPTPMAAALHSSMAPVLASLDLFDRNFLAGRVVETDLLLINERHQDVPGKVDVYVTPKDPQFVPTEASLKAAVSRQSFEWLFKAGRIQRKPIRWKVPAEQGRYYLAAVVRREGDSPVVSQRVLRAVGLTPREGRLEGRHVLALGADEEVKAYLKAHGVAYSTALKKGKVEADVVLVWDAAALPEGGRPAARAVLDFARAGGRVVILTRRGWPWKELADFRVGRLGASRAFAYPRVRHRLLRGIDPEMLKRWNGLPGTIASGAIQGDVLAQGEKLLWVQNPGKTVALSLPVGRGELLICLLQFQRRLHPDSKSYDPAADRLFRNLLGP